MVGLEILETFLAAFLLWIIPLDAALSYAEITFLSNSSLFSDSLARMSKEEVNERWQKIMAPFFEIPEGAAPDQSMIEIEEVFHLD